MSWTDKFALYQYRCTNKNVFDQRINQAFGFSRIRGLVSTKRSQEILPRARWWSNDQFAFWSNREPLDGTLLICGVFLFGACGRVNSNLAKQRKERIHSSRMKADSRAVITFRETSAVIITMVGNTRRGFDALIISKQSSFPRSAFGIEGSIWSN